MTVDFYASYAAYKDYRQPRLGRKESRRFDAEIWTPAGFSSEHACLEIGCGTGAFLAYLASKGVTRFTGIDHDPNLRAVLPDGIEPHFECVDVWAFLDRDHPAKFDRVVMMDVLEHFAPEDAWRLLSMVRDNLAPDGKVVIKVPNASSPWGLTYQFGDLTHKTPFNPESLKQLALAAGLRVERVYAQRQGSRRRMITDRLVHKFLSWALLVPPPVWSANLYCILTPGRVPPEAGS